METHDDILRYINGNIKANLVLEEVLGHGVRLSAEFSILAIIVMIYSNLFSVISICLACITTTTFIIGCVLNVKYNASSHQFKNNNPIPAPEALNPENVTKYVDQSLDVIRIGVATAVMNMLTSAFAIILIILAILSVIK